MTLFLKKCNDEMLEYYHIPYLDFTLDGDKIFLDDSHLLINNKQYHLQDYTIDRFWVQNVKGSPTIILSLDLNNSEEYVYSHVTFVYRKENKEWKDSIYGAYFYHSEQELYTWKKKHIVGLDFYRAKQVVINPLYVMDLHWDIYNYDKRIWRGRKVDSIAFDGKYLYLYKESKEKWFIWNGQKWTRKYIVPYIRSKANLSTTIYTVCNLDSKIQYKELPNITPMDSKSLWPILQITHEDKTFWHQGLFYIKSPGLHARVFGEYNVNRIQYLHPRLKSKLVYYLFLLKSKTLTGSCLSSYIPKSLFLNKIYPNIIC